jgi:hypothetical protein
LVFACSQVVEDAIAQQVCVLPFDRRQGGGNDELGGAVDVVGEGVVGARLVGPIGGELVVGPSAQQDCVGGRLPKRIVSAAACLFWIRAVTSSLKYDWIDCSGISMTPSSVTNSSATMRLIVETALASRAHVLAITPPSTASI